MIAHFSQTLLFSSAPFLPRSKLHLNFISVIILVMVYASIENQLQAVEIVEPVIVHLIHAATSYILAEAYSKSVFRRHTPTHAPLHKALVVLIIEVEQRILPVSLSMLVAHIKHQIIVRDVHEVSVVLHALICGISVRLLDDTVADAVVHPQFPSELNSIRGTAS